MNVTLCAHTLGERFREMVCPSLLRKEMGDLVLAIRTAFSSAFRSKVSVDRSEQCLPRTAPQSPDRNHAPLQGTCGRRLTDSEGLPTKTDEHAQPQKTSERKCMLRPKHFLFHPHPQNHPTPYTSVAATHTSTLERVDSAWDYHSRLVKLNFEKENFRLGWRVEGDET